MANSDIIGKIKRKIVREFIKDDLIVQAINSSTISPQTPEKLINSHIFTYNQNPFTLNQVLTFITIQVHLPQSPMYDYNKTYISSNIEIWIISHERHMVVDNIPKVIDNRNDYLSELIDKKLNGRSDYGIGKLKLASNVEGSFQQDYVYRKMLFEGMDLNESLCEEE